MKFILLLLLLATSVQASDVWFTLGNIGEKTFQMRKNSLEIGKTDGMKYASVIGRVTENSSAEPYLWMVFEKDCIQGYGTLYTKTLQGNLINEVSFTYNGATSLISRGICEAALNDG